MVKIFWGWLIVLDVLFFGWSIKNTLKGLVFQHTGSKNLLKIEDPYKCFLLDTKKTQKLSKLFLIWKC